MGQYTSYYLYQKFEKRDGQDFIPVYPNTYSVDADGTMPKVIKEQNDVNCGYVPPSDPIYQWVQITPTSDPDSYWCDNCPAEPIYRWTVMTPTSDPDTYWCDDCPIEPIYRWADSGTTCVGYDKYQRAIRQVSYDNGSTWENVSPVEYSATTLIEANSEDCGYVPPTPTNYKITMYYEHEEPYYVDCNSYSTLTSTDTYTSERDDTELISAVIGNCVKTIGVGAFFNVPSLRSVTIPNTVTTIEGSAFSGCTSLSSVTIPDSVTNIGSSAFDECTSLTSCTIGNSVTSIGNYTFHLCTSLTSITIPDSVTSIGNYAFQSCLLIESITIGSGVTNIGKSAFNNCYYRLTSLNIPSGVTSIDDYAFAGCNSLTGITVNAVTPPTLGSMVFDSTNDCPIYVPSGSVTTYKNRWSAYASRIQAIQT